MSHKIAHLSLDFAGEESVSGGERKCQDLSVSLILLRLPASAVRPLRGLVVTVRCAVITEKRSPK
jgi:hypothetical protein